MLLPLGGIQIQLQLTQHQLSQKIHKKKLNLGSQFLVMGTKLQLLASIVQ